MNRYHVVYRRGTKRPRWHLVIVKARSVPEIYRQAEKTNREHGHDPRVRVEIIRVHKLDERED